MATCTSNETRALTLISCIDRLYRSYRQTTCTVNQELVLHIVGADYREGNTVIETFHIFQKALEFVQNKYQYKYIEMTFIGPNISSSLHEKVEIITMGRMKIQICYFVGAYDEIFLSSHLYSKPNLAICFNAGIWGYDNWIPTLELLVHQIHVPVLITSYNEHEAELDEDTLIEKMQIPNWLWRAEKNEFGSSEQRETKNENGFILHENDYWQCIGPLMTD